MASIKVIAEAKIQAMGIKTLFGVAPELDIQDDYVRLYYPPDKIQLAQDKFKVIMASPPGPIRYDFNGVAVPWGIKNFGLGILGLAVFGFFIGRYT